MKNFKYLIFIPLLFIFSCDLNYNNENYNPQENKTTISFMTWNTQTFFDGVTDGCEYSDFKKSKYWDNEKYQVRLERLCEVFDAIKADIIVLQEIENEAVMQDISNMLAGNYWSQKNIWPYGAFAKVEGDAIGCGIFSKYPISNIKTHNLKINTEKKEQPSMRPIMEVTVSINEKELPIFINHWKSKSGGTEETEVWRNWQEGVLCNSINKLKKSGIKFCIAAGDFNRDINDFFIINDNPSCKENILLRDNFNYSENIKVHSPWLNINNNLTKDKGSYYFNENWQKIDNIFVWGDIEIFEFGPVAWEPWVDLQGIPLKYLCYTGEGYSDHLPLFCKLTF